MNLFANHHLPLPAFCFALFTMRSETEMFTNILLQMAHVASKRVSLDDIWPDLEEGITQLVTNLNAGFPRKRWMDLYSYPHFAPIPSLPYFPQPATSYLLPLLLF